MDGAVNGETGRVDVEIVWIDLVAFLINAHQAGSRNFLEHHSVGVDQEMMLVTGNSHREMGEDKVVPAVESNQSVGGGKVNAKLPLLLTDFTLFGWNCQLLGHSADPSESVGFIVD